MAAVKTPTRKKKDRPESEVLKECLDALHAAFWPGFFWRQNAGETRTLHGHYIYLGPDGIADIVGLLPWGGVALIVFVECKRRKGKQRETQKAFQAAVEALGAIYVVARTGAEAVEGVKARLPVPGQGASLPPPLPPQSPQ